MRYTRWEYSPYQPTANTSQVFYSNQKMKLETRTYVVEMANYAKQCDIELRDIADDTAEPLNAMYDADLLVDPNAKEDRRYLLLYGIKPKDEQERRFLRLYDHVDHCEEYFGVKLGQNQKKVALLEVLVLCIQHLRRATSRAHCLSMSLFLYGNDPYGSRCRFYHCRSTRRKDICSVCRRCVLARYSAGCKQHMLLYYLQKSSNRCVGSNSSSIRIL